MTASETSLEFQRNTKALAAPLRGSEIRECYGVSNSAKFVTGGFLCGIPNLDSLDASVSALCVFSRIQLGPKSELHTAILIRKDYPNLLARLKEMVSNPLSELFGKRNQNCAIFLASDGKLYAHNKAKDTFALTDEVLRQIGPGVIPDTLFWAVYGDETEATRGAISQLRALIGDANLLKIEVSNTQARNQMSEETEGDVRGLVNEATQSLNNANLKASRNLVLRFSAALLAKRFLILTGLSGSGKTKLAHAFASWICESPDQYRLVAVGADWTTNENVVGYQDALQPCVYRKPSNGLLDVILRARNDESRPYFLILDEMNLSHVERYFADILSAIESRQEIALHSAAEDLNKDDALPVPAKLALPENLFIIGTVNVDETTYMFSPKVLDRANVIEFRAKTEDIAAFFDNPAAVNMEALAGQGSAYGPAFAAEAGRETQLAGEIASALKERMAEIFAMLAPIGAEFGFRTAYEIARFVHHHEKLSGGDWQFNDALDAQVLQKLMPKLHGSQRRLEPVLNALETFCAAHQCEASLEKIRRMKERLKDGFASYAEA